MILRRLLIATIFLASETWSQAQQINPVPDYVFRNQMSVGRNAVTDTGAYFSIGPRYGAVKGFMPPIVSDTASVNANKRNGLLIFSVQKNKFLYWDSVRVQWSDMAGSSGSYITGKGITGYVPQYTDTATLDTSALYTLGNQLGIGTSSFAYTGSGRTVVELNGTAGGLYGFKRNDSAKGYLFHNGDNMELANTVAGSISFNTNSATRGSIASDGVWRLNNLAGTGDRVVQASSNGTLSATASVTGLVDTLTISTRAWRQKGLDSLAALEVSGSGTTNYVPKFTASTTIGNSVIYNAGGLVGINTASPVEMLSLSGGVGNTFGISLNPSGWNNAKHRYSVPSSGDEGFLSYNYNGSAVDFASYATSSIAVGNGVLRFSTGGTNAAPSERMRIFANGRVFIGASPTDAGYQLDINGTLRSVNGANFATTSGNVGVGTASPSAKLTVVGSGAQTILNSGSAADARMEFHYNSGREGFISWDTDNLRLQADAGNYLTFYTNATEAMRITSSGNVGIGTASPAYKFHTLTSDATIAAFRNSGAANGQILIGNTAGDLSIRTLSTGDSYIFSDAGKYLDFGSNASFRMRLTSDGELLVSTTSDAGDYKLQVVGNARIGTGKLDIASNTTFGIGVARSGTSEVAGQIYNSNGILYLGAESSTGGQIFTGSSAYAAVIGSGANYPLQFATNNATRATINTNGELLINTLTDNGDFKLQVNGNALISGSIKTANGGSSTAVPWHLGSVVATSVQLDTANYVEVEINGTFYRLAIVTPL